MKKTEDTKAFYYFDESGDPVVLGRKGENLVAIGKTSKVFIVGYLETKQPKEITKALKNLHTEIISDDYLSGIPSMESTRICFHANKDCAEVREKVFRLLKQFDFQVYCIVARKNADQFRRKFDLKSAKLYEYLVAKLLENRLHLYSEVDIYFASMGNVVRRQNMSSAIQTAICTFKEKWGKENTSEIKTFIQQSSEIPLLQAVDYMLWSINRVYEKDDFRFYNFMKEKIYLVQDIFDTAKYPHTYYSPKNPLEKEKMSPI